MRFRQLLLVLASASSLLFAYAQEDPVIGTVLEGLYHPVGMELLPDGSVLISEMGSLEQDTRFGFSRYSAGVSLLRPDGTIGRLVSGFPSGHDPSDFLGVLPLALSPDKQTLYIGHHGAQQLFTLPASQATRLPARPFTTYDLGSAFAGGGTFLLHPFDIAFDEGHRPLVTDTLANSIVVETERGAKRSFHRFDGVDDPRHLDAALEAVPRGMTRVGDELLVTLFAGCPHPANSGELVAVDDEGNQRTVIDNLNMPIDVAVDAAGRVWLLEFATPATSEACFKLDDFRSNSGRLSRINSDGTLQTVIDNLDFPGAILPMPDGSLYITEIFAGRVRHLRFDDEREPMQRFTSIDIPEPQYVEIADYDDALQRVIELEGLVPYPGSDQIEGDTPLARLGRDLFFDPILSGDKNISCATCHHPAFAMADGRTLSIGAGGHGLGEGRVFLPQVTVSTDTRFNLNGVLANPFIDSFIPRNSPTVINAAVARSQFWDSKVERKASDGLVRTPDDAVTDLGLSDTAIAQAMLPIVSRREMAGVTFGDEPSTVIRESLAQRLRAIPGYVAQFEAVFNTTNIQPLHIAEALAAFERQLIFTAAPWDDYIAGDSEALSHQQKRGALLFYGELNPQLSCVQCHSGNMFTDVRHYNLLVPQIGTGKRNGPSGRDDFGRSNVTFDYRDQYKFRTPSLRNVELTGPYFHSGVYPILADVIWHHADIWRGNMAYDPNNYLPPAMRDSLFSYKFERQSHSVAPQLQNGLPVSEDDVRDLVAFLTALTDPDARDLSHLTPDSVPSGLALDPLPF